MNIKINEVKIGNGKKVFIIAEAGVNHNGRLELAQKMVDSAKMAGADAIKFQAFKAERLVTGAAPKAKYQRGDNSGGSQFALLKKLEFSEADFKILFDYCRKKKIIFLSTPFDQQSAEFLYNLGVTAFKISSGDLTDLPLLQKIASFKKPIFLSTGMAELQEVNEAVKAIYSADNRHLVLLHCTSNYPTKFSDVNLKAILTLRKEFGVPIGYSDHTGGIEMPIAAVAMGACVIEKHLTLDKNLPGPDHKASVEPEEFRKMVEAIKKVEVALGDGLKKPRQSEMEMRRIARKSVVSTRKLFPGAAITREMLAIKRPGTGVAPKDLDCLIGKRVKRMIKQDSPIQWNLIA